MRPADRSRRVARVACYPVTRVAPKFRRQFARATAVSIVPAKYLVLLASDLRIERRERRRAVQFIADHDLLDADATAEHPTDVELVTASLACGRREP